MWVTVSAKRLLPNNVSGHSGSSAMTMAPSADVVFLVEVTDEGPGISLVTIVFVLFSTVLGYALFLCCRKIRKSFLMRLFSFLRVSYRKAVARGSDYGVSIFSYPPCYFTLTHC